MCPFGFKLLWSLRFSSAVFSFFFFGSARICWLLHSEQCIRALFTDPQIPLFNNFFIKNGSHNTIHTFKNYFATVFSVSVFSFSKNKFNPNGPYVDKPIWVFLCILDSYAILHDRCSRTTSFVTVYWSYQWWIVDYHLQMDIQFIFL